MYARHELYLSIAYSAIARTRGYCHTNTIVNARIHVWKQAIHQFTYEQCCHTAIFPIRDASESNWMGLC